HRLWPRCGFDRRDHYPGWRRPTEQFLRLPGPAHERCAGYSRRSHGERRSSDRRRPDVCADRRPSRRQCRGAAHWRAAARTADDAGTGEEGSRSEGLVMMTTHRKFVDTEVESADWAGWLTQVI